MSKFFFADSLADYEHLNLKPGIVEKWEDGMRTHGGKGTYEWWYFDAHLDDGSKIVIVFYTKAMTEVNKPLKAYATINIDLKDGSKLERYLPSSDFYSSKDECDVRIGKCSFKGDLNFYNIHLEGGDFIFDAKISSVSKSWRPETGHLFFGKKRNLFAWVVPVPKGTVSLFYKFPGIEITTKGSCYHDHNWGDISLHKLIDHWYWARAEFGPYTIIGAQIIPRKKFKQNPVNIIMILKDGKKIADSSDNMEFLKLNPFISEIGKKPISNQIIFNYHENEFKFKLELNRTKNILQTYLIQEEFKRKLAKFLIGFNGAYFRITGDSKLSVKIGIEPEITYTNNNTIWELMYFGNPD